MMRIAIIGGGIAGLAAAYELELARQAGQAVEYQLFESSSRLGGVISSEVAGGTVLEYGPDSFLTEKTAGAELCRELGLAADLVPSDDANRKTYLLVHNRLVALPDGLMFLIPTRLVPTLLTPLFSPLTKLRMALELLQKRPARSQFSQAKSDESVAALVERHYGRQVVERLADPLLSGIYGGDADQLSARSVLPRLVEMEEKYGSLTRAMLAQLRARKAAEDEMEVVPAPRPIFTTLRYGLQQLIGAIAARLDPASIHLQTPVTQLMRREHGWSVQAVSQPETDGSKQDFDAVILATPAWVAADLIRTGDSALAAELDGIPYSSSITVNLVYDGVDSAIAPGPLPAGFGFLVPASEGRAMLACTFIHRKFPGRTAPGKTVLRVFLGGVRNAHLLAESDDNIATLVRKEVRQILSISARPERIAISRWPRAMAQYTVGHAERQQRIRERLTQLPGIYLAGNAYDGIGISDCIRLGREAAREAAEFLAEAADHATIQSGYSDD